MFFSFDGLDGVGKTTQLELFCEWLQSQGHEVVRCYDPGSTALGERIRELLLVEKSVTFGRRSEMLLFMAARAQLVDEIIRPALDRGATVVSDRFLLANVVYQGHAGGLDVDAIWQIGQIVTLGIRPQLTIVLDMPAESASQRIARGLDRMESQGEAFQSRLRQGFLHEAAKNPGEIVVVDAARPIDVIQADIRRHAARVLNAS